MSTRLKPLPKFLILLCIVGGLYGLFTYVKNAKFVQDIVAPTVNHGNGDISDKPVTDNKVNDTKSVAVNTSSAIPASVKPPIATPSIQKKNDVKPINIGVCTWGGYSGGQWFNNGFNANEKSRYWTEYGILVNFKVIDDPVNLIDAWKSGEIDLAWSTADVFPIIASSLKEQSPVAIFQSDWSRGGDVFIVNRNINSINELKGKKVAVAFESPSHTFLLWLLQSAGMRYSDIEIVEAPSAPDAAAYFKAGRVDAAVVWSPDDVDCIQNVSGAKRLNSTRDASHIIPAIFFGKKNYVESHQKELTGLVEGWLRGSSEINHSDDIKMKAAKILADGYQQPVDFMLTAINNAYMVSYQDEVDFFNINGTFKGVKGEDIYNKMSRLYHNIGHCPENVPSWRTVIYTNILRGVDSSKFANDAPEQVATFTKIDESKKEQPKAIATKMVSISFPTASFTLDENAKRIIDLEFADIAKMFANARIRVEGNTDNVGGEAGNMTLSMKRAQAVADYLIAQYNFDTNRIMVVGNGPKKPIADNSTSDGKARNRRTDFQLLESGK